MQTQSTQTKEAPSHTHTHSHRHKHINSAIFKHTYTHTHRHSLLLSLTHMRNTLELRHKEIRHTHTQVQFTPRGRHKGTHTQRLTIQVKKGINDTIIVMILI